MKDLKRELFNDSKYTFIVSGARGTGKSTAVMKLLDKRENTVIGSCHGTWDDYLIRLVKNLGVDIPQPPPQSRPFALSVERGIFRRALTVLKKSGVTPIVVVELDERCTPEQLVTLLLEMKALGHDDLLAKFVVLVPSPWILNNVEIGLSELRCQYFPTDDLSKDEAKKFLTYVFSDEVKRLTGVQLTTPEVRVLIDRTIETVGTRILHLREVQHLVTIKSRGKSESVCKDDIQSWIDEYTRRKVEASKVVISAFLQKFSHQIKKEKANKFFMKLISNTPIDVIEAAKELDISAQQLMKTPADILYYVDPETLIVTVGSKFMVEAIKIFLKEQQKN